MTGLCYSCNLPSGDEYGWYDEEGELHIWELCEECCNFAIDVVESITYIEEEVEEWIRER